MKDHSNFDSLAVPTPPYARLAMAKTESKKPSEQYGDDELAALEAQYYAGSPQKTPESPEEQKAEGEPAIEAAAEDAKNAIQEEAPVNAEDEANKSTAQQRIDAQAEVFKAQYNEVRPAKRAGDAKLDAEFSGTGRKLETLEEEHDSTEAALRRMKAEGEGDTPEAKNMEKRLEEYSAAIVKKDEITPPSSAPHKAITMDDKHAMPFDIEQQVKSDIAQQKAAVKAAERRAARAKPAPAEVPQPAPAEEPIVPEPVIAEHVTEKPADEGVTPPETVTDPSIEEEPVVLLPVTPQEAPVSEEEPIVLGPVIPAKPTEQPVQEAPQPSGTSEAEMQAEAARRRREEINAKSAATRAKNKAAAIVREERAQEERAQQEVFGQEMLEQEDARLAKEGREKLPRPDRGGTIFKVKEGLRYVVEKTDAKPYLDTLMPRWKAFFTRTLVSANAFFQSRAQGNLDIAKEKIEEFTDKLEDAGPLAKAYYRARLRTWQEHATRMEARTDKWNGRRQRRVEGHNDIQRQMIDRYNLELEPHKELVRDFSMRLETQQKTRDTLAKKRDEAVQKLAEVAALGKKGGHLPSGYRAEKAVATIREQIKDMDRRIKETDKAADRFRGRLAASQAGVDKWELKKKVAAQFMEFPELKGMKRPDRGPEVAVPGVGSIDTTVTPRASRTESASGTPETDPATRTWEPVKFVEAWNNLGLERIDDAAGFIEYVRHERMRLRASGDPTAKQLLDFVGPYISRGSSPKVDAKKLKKDQTFFLNNA